MSMMPVTASALPSTIPCDSFEPHNFIVKCPAIFAFSLSLLVHSPNHTAGAGTLAQVIKGGKLIRRRQRFKAGWSALEPRLQPLAHHISASRHQHIDRKRARRQLWVWTRMWSPVPLHLSIPLLIFRGARGSFVGRMPSALDSVHVGEADHRNHLPFALQEVLQHDGVPLADRNLHQPWR